MKTPKSNGDSGRNRGNIMKHSQIKEIKYVLLSMNSSKDCWPFPCLIQVSRRSPHEHITAEFLRELTSSRGDSLLDFDIAPIPSVQQPVFVSGLIHNRKSSSQHLLSPSQCCVLTQLTIRCKRRSELASSSRWTFDNEMTASN